MMYNNCIKLMENRMVIETGCSIMKKMAVMALSLLLLLAGCSAEPVATVGDIEIGESEFNFYLTSIKNEMSDTELQTEEDWQNKEIEGKKAIDVAKDQAIENAVLNALYIETAEAAGLVLTAEEEEYVNSTKDKFVASYGSESVYKKFLKANDISDDFIEMMCRSTVYYQKIGSEVTKDLVIEESDKKTYFDENSTAFDSEIWKAKHILISTKDAETNQPKTPEEVSDAKALAEDILARAKGGENFDALMKEYSEDPGLETAPDGYVFGRGEMVQEFENATVSAGIGEITFCESDFGYHIIMRMPLNYDDVKDTIENRFVADLIDKQVMTWKDEFGIVVTKNDKLLAEIK